MFSFLSDLLIGEEGWLELVPFAAFLIAVFSALRLAKFNNDSRQTTSFYGLPVPANALFWAALVSGSYEWLLSIPWWVVMIAILISCWLLVSELPMFSLKFKNLSWADNKVQFLFLAVSAALLFFGVSGIALIILWYIALSVAIWVYNISNSKVE
jgi:CDP-diacylglycerol--serine O-phosphatidyltransferase